MIKGLEYPSYEERLRDGTASLSRLDKLISKDSFQSQPLLFCTFIEQMNTIIFLLQICTLQTLNIFSLFFEYQCFRIDNYILTYCFPDESYVALISNLLNLLLLLLLLYCYFIDNKMKHL